MGEENKPNLALPLPSSVQQIRALQRERKVLAVENARRTPFWRSRLTHIDLCIIKIRPLLKSKVAGGACRARNSTHASDRREVL